MDLSNTKLSKLITQAELKESFVYDTINGGLIRIKAAGGRKVGDRFGCRMGEYVYGKLKGRYYLEHTLVYLYMVGEHPTNTVDHIDGVGSNNRWENLRAATYTQNMFNAALRVDNPTGVKGVSYRYIGKKKVYRARISINKKTYVKSVSLISNRTEEGIMKELTDWVVEKRKKLHGDYANFGKGMLITPLVACLQ